MYEEILRIINITFLVFYILIYHDLSKKEKTEKRDFIMFFLLVLILTKISAYLVVSSGVSVLVNHIAYKSLNLLVLLIIPCWFILTISKYLTKGTIDSSKVAFKLPVVILLFAPAIIFYILIFFSSTKNIYYPLMGVFWLANSRFPYLVTAISIFYFCLAVLVIIKILKFNKYAKNANNFFVYFDILVSLFYAYTSLTVVSGKIAIHFSTLAVFSFIVLLGIYYDSYRTKKYVNKSAILNQVMQRMEQPFFVCNAEREIVSINDAVKEIIPEFKYTNQYKRRIYDIESLSIIAAGMDKDFSTAKFTIFTDEYVKYLEASISCVKDKGKIIGFGVVITDQTPITNALEKQRKLAEEDYLTNLYNRRTYMSYVDKFYEESSNKDNEFTFIMFDLDNFKRVNDTYSHLAGDEVLIRFSEMLKQSCKYKMAVGRYGGEEFSVAMTGYDEEFIRNFCDEINQKTRDLDIIYEDINIKITVSIGACVTSNPKNYELNKLIAEADDALYKSKQTGKDKYTLVKF